VLAEADPSLATVPLKERGIFLGYLGATWAIASALGASIPRLPPSFDDPMLTFLRAIKARPSVVL
jgi:hypothetical protein